MTKRSSKIWNAIAVIFWLVSFILSFNIHPGSPFIWLPDTLLLLGFCPLFIGMKARWLWLVFGIGNMFIGFVLLVALYLPEQSLSTYHLLDINMHMKLYHSYLAWLLIGILSTIIGVALLTVRLFAFVANHRPK